jgi:hypothetical protein
MITSLYHLLDLALMPLYRFPDNPLAGYYLGTLVLAFAGLIIGEYSIAFAFRLNKKMIDRDNNRIHYFQDLSFEALKAGDKAAFKACNGIANETYGKHFFTQVTLSAASLWPLFIALGWMQYRFSEVEFHLPFSVPMIGGTLGYVSTFLFCYIAVRIMKKKLRRFICTARAV